MQARMQSQKRREREREDLSKRQFLSRMGLVYRRAIRSNTLYLITLSFLLERASSELSYHVLVCSSFSVFCCAFVLTGETGKHLTSLEEM